MSYDPERDYNPSSGAAPILVGLLLIFFLGTVAGATFGFGSGISAGTEKACKSTCIYSHHNDGIWLPNAEYCQCIDWSYSG